MENTIAIKLTYPEKPKAGEQENIRRSPAEEIDATVCNAEQHSGKTLFTVGHKVDLRRWKDQLEYLIATTRDGKKALIARIADFNRRDENPATEPNLDEFPQVPPYAPDDKNTWFALSDVRAIEIHEGDFSNDEGRDLLDLIGGRSSRSYISYSEQK